MHRHLHNSMHCFILFESSFLFRNDSHKSSVPNVTVTTQLVHGLSNIHIKTDDKMLPLCYGEHIPQLATRVIFKNPEEVLNDDTEVS